MRRAVPVIGALLVTLWMATSAIAAPLTVSWVMDETAGTVMYSSDGVTNGTIIGDVQLGVPGVTGTAYAFNENVGSCDASFTATGTGQVTIPYSSAFAVGDQPFSFGGFINTTAQPLADSGATKNCDFDVWRQSNRWKLELYPRSSKKPYGVAHCIWRGVLNGTVVKVGLKGKTDVTDGAWHDLVCARTASGESVIIDGVTENSSSVNVGSIQSSDNVFVGTQQAGQDFYEGYLDDLSFTVG